MKTFFSNPVLIIALLIAFPPLGIFIMYRFSEWDSNWKLGLSVVFMIIWIASIFMSINQEAQLAATGMRGCISNII